VQTATPERDGPEEAASSGLLWNLGSAIVPLLGSFAVSVLIAPYLGAQRWGHYSLVVSAATLLLILAKFGVHTATSRLITENDEEAGRWLRAGLLVRSAFTLSTSLLAFLLSPALARSFGDADLVQPFWLVAPIVLSASYLEFGAEVLVGLRSFRMLFLNRGLFLLLRLAAVAAVRLGQLGVTAFLAGHVIAQTVPAAVVLGAMLRRHPGVAWDETAAAARRTAQLSVPLALSTASFLVYAHTDRLMLGWFSSEAVVGQFSVARNVLDASLFPVTALAWSLRPALVRAWGAGGSSGAARTVADGMRWSFLFGVAMPSLLFVFGPGLVVSLYTGLYSDASQLLVWMLPILFLRGIGAVIFPALLALDAQARYARLMGWTAALNVLTNLALIPPLGARGAVLATIVSQLPLVVGGFADLRRSLGTLGLRRHLRWHLLALGSSLGVATFAWYGWTPRDSLGSQLVGALVAGGILAAINLLPWWWDRRNPRSGPGTDP
jgi:PST family polysaccharide transporter